MLNALSDLTVNEGLKIWFWIKFFQLSVIGEACQAKIKVIRGAHVIIEYKLT